MDKNPELALTRPISIWQKPIKADFKELFKALGKGILDGAFQNWNNVGLDLADATAALGVETQPEEIAWLLIYKSLVTAIKALIYESQNLMQERKPSDEELEESCQSLKSHLDHFEVTIDINFFQNPKQLPILEEIKPHLVHWLEHFVETQSQAKTITNRLPSYFVFALHEEWHTNTEAYVRILEKLGQVDTPFTKASKWEQDWLQYFAFLQKTIEEPMFDEAFSLKQVYVPLCAYFVKTLPQTEDGSYEQEVEPKEKYCVVDLPSTLNNWLEKADPNDAMRLISGGPGCGKSSFTKIFVADLVDNNNQKALFIPLHQFNSSGDLVESVGKYLQETRLLSFNPLETETEGSRLLLVFDGLDELAMQGKWGAEAAQQFVRDVSRTVERLNLNKMRVQVLMSGRELVVQSISEFKREGQILHVLPFFIPENTRTKYDDPQDLLQLDRRDKWWQKYGETRGAGIPKAPDVLKAENLTEITSQPLLNYLVALSYTRGELNFAKTSNLNEVYADLLASIYERGWEKKKQHPAIEDISEDNFTLILEEIAVSAWHGNGRTTTVLEIEKRCDCKELKQQFSCFKKGAEEGVTRLLTAFYFRQSGLRNSEYTFEFTHKSFGEYLTSKRIIRQIERTHRMLNKEESYEGWDKEAALSHWVTLCGSSELDKYVYKFLCDEVALKHKETVKAWQTTFCQLVEYMLGHGMPMERIHPRPEYKEECRQARNAEEALLATLSACAWYIKEPYRIPWTDEKSFTFWLGRLQDLNSRAALVASCLNHLNLCGCCLKGANLERANLNGANLEGANLEGANLERANLNGTNLERASLNGSNIVGASLHGANLVGSNLHGANLYRANLCGANLEGANLEGAIGLK